jgi:iron complex transport system substrate-binding protein
MRGTGLLITICLFIACNQPSSRKAASDSTSDTIKNFIATGYRIIKNKTSTTLEVLNPWQQANNILIKYNLVASPIHTKNQLKDRNIHIPVKRAICMSTTYIAFLDALGEINAITGVSGSKYINNAEIQDKISTREIYDVGYEQTLNYEMLVSLKPDVVFAYGVGGEIAGYTNKLSELGIPVVLVGDYLESDPLAKAEWLKFFAEFFNKQEIANKKFTSIFYQYQELKKIASGSGFKPSVIVNLPWNGSWRIAGGNSYIARLISDAGGNYLWKNNNSDETIPIDLETAFHEALYSDYWINIGTANNRNDILKVDSRFGNLQSFKSGNLYNNNSRSNKDGGNDYWETGALNPQLILKDLIVILHPELMHGQKLYYYKKIF